MQSRRSLKIQPIAVDIEELVPSDLAQEEEPKPINVNKIEKELKYPFDMKNIKAREVVTLSSFGRYPDTCYDVTCFKSVEFTSKQVCFEVQKLYPDYQFKVYAYRAKKKSATTTIGKMVFNLKPDHQKKFVHINVELHD